MLLSHEESYWFQQCKCKWVVMGDQNSSFFFHQSTIKRRRINRIMALQYESSQWIYEDSILQDHICQFFANLYKSSYQSNIGFVSLSSYPIIKEDRLYLEGDISLEETKRAFFSMNNYKSPGPDGYRPHFFKSQWYFLGNSIHYLVRDCFNNPGKIKDVNHTLITLIPKCEDPSKVIHLRHIALCNVSYKIISKVVSQRLKMILPYVVSQNQSSFISGRSTVDNILVMQEAIHSLNCLKGKKGFMIIKLDLEKAYDCLEWSFIMDSLRLLGIPSSLKNIIYHCISSANLSINWNGNPTPSFSSSRGLRQGDPISPYLFVLALERLGHKIQDLVNNGNWKPLTFGRGNGPIMSHICFADDIVLVAEASSDQVHMIRDLLDAFCMNSGQKVSLNKSKVFFS